MGFVSAGRWLLRGVFIDSMSSCIVLLVCAKS
jgi:hypothetical protein